MNKNTSTSALLLDGMADEEAFEYEGPEGQPSDADLNDDDVVDAPEEATDAPTKREFEKGTWQATAKEAAVLYGRAEKAGNKAGLMLWQGATAAIAEWEVDADEDVDAERLSHNLLVIMGTKRKGDVSKIKKVALAVRAKGLQTSQYPNLSKAYAAAKDLLDTSVVEGSEDNAADEAIQAVAEDAPKTATTVESAAKMLLALAGGPDEVARQINDAINHGGQENHEAHRAMARAFAQDAAGRVKAVADKEKAEAEAKRGALIAEREAAQRAKAEETKAKPPAAKKTAAKKATPVQTDKTKTALPPKASTTDDGASDLDALADDAPVAPKPAAKKAAAPKPGARRA